MTIYDMYDEISRTLNDPIFTLGIILVLCYNPKTKKQPSWPFYLQDILIGLLKKTMSKGGSHGRSVPLKVVVMSATLETEKLSSFLGHCPVFSIPGRTFPVTEKFLNLIGPKDTESSAYIKEVGSKTVCVCVCVFVAMSYSWIVLLHVDCAVVVTHEYAVMSLL